MRVLITAIIIIAALFSLVASRIICIILIGLAVAFIVEGMLRKRRDILGAKNWTIWCIVYISVVWIIIEIIAGTF